MSIVRWDPWDEMMSLREAMDQLLRESFVRPRGGTSQGSMGMGMSGGMSMPIDVRENDDDFVVKATMPGVRPEDVQIQIKGDTLQITGEVKEEYEAPGGQQQRMASRQQGQQAQQTQMQGTSRQQGQGNWLVRERRFGRFQRMITLPTNVKADQAEATFENGILTITLPKAEESRARSIPVRAGGGTQQIEAQSKPQS